MISFLSLLALAIPQEPAAADAWTWRVAPYLWAVQVDGSASVRSAGVDFGADFGDLLDNMDGAGLVFVEGRSGRVSVLADFIYMGLEQDGERQSGAATSGELDTTILQFASLTRISDTSPLEFGAGLRWTQMDAELSVGPVTTSGDANVFDGFVAGRASWTLGKRWSLMFYGDMGAGDSDFTWQANGMLGFRFADWGSLDLGYRILDYAFESGSTDVDMSFEGALLGLTFWF